MKRPCIEVYRDKAGEWRWHALARNGRIVALSDAMQRIEHREAEPCDA